MCAMPSMASSVQPGEDKAGLLQPSCTSSLHSCSVFICIQYRSTKDYECWHLYPNLPKAQIWSEDVEMQIDRGFWDHSVYRCSCCRLILFFAHGYRFTHCIAQVFFSDVPSFANIKACSLFCMCCIK